MSEQLTLIEESFALTVVEGENLQLTLDGGNGPSGAAGPNTITTSTTAPSLTGYIFGNGTTIAGATAATNDPTASTLARRDSAGGCQFTDLSATVSFDAGTFSVDSLTGSTFEAGSSVTFNATAYTYGTGAASAHRIALGAGTTGATLFGAADAAAARTTLGLATSDSPTFAGAAISASTASTSKDTGALVIQNGGLGVEGAIYAGGAVNGGINSSFSGIRTNSGNGIIISVDGAYTSGVRLQVFSDVKLRIGNISGSSGVYLGFGTSGTLAVRNYADSADGNITAANLTASGTLAVTGASTLTGGATFGDSTQQAATRIALGAGTTGATLFGAADAGAARTTLGLATTDSPTFAGLTASGAVKVGTATTADATSDVLIATSATTQRGLTIQAKASQTAPLLRIAESTNGTANNGWEFNLSSATVATSGTKSYFNAVTLIVSPSFLFGFSSNSANPFAAKTLGFAATSAGSGVLEINNGTLGTLRDLTLRNLTASGTVKTGGYTFATLPTPTTGMRAYITDGALAPIYMANAAGGSTVVTPVFYNGTNWINA